MVSGISLKKVGTSYSQESAKIMKMWECGGNLCHV